MPKRLVAVITSLKSKWEKTVLNEYEEFVLNYFVSEYPEDKTFSEILDLIESEKEEDQYAVLLFDPFTYMEPEHLTGLMSELAYDLRDLFIPREKLQYEIALALNKKK